MMTRFALAVALLTLFSCGSRTANKTITVPEGTFTGQFIRSSPLARYAPSNVTLTFAGNKFSGESDKTNYPSICQGTFTVSGNRIEFVNECSWTADFDWSYILKGSFEFTAADSTLEMTRTSGDNTDHYSLKLQ